MTKSVRNAEKSSRNGLATSKYSFTVAQRSGKNIISVSRTGSGKTLTYLMPLIDSPDGIVIIVTALNILGEQFVAAAEAAGFSAISVNGQNDTKSVLDVRPDVNLARHVVHCEAVELVNMDVLHAEMSSALLLGYGGNLRLELTCDECDREAFSRKL
ncbi:hypothetical protein BC629DRAFT_1440397 [Irpex lacteus]|nr:hypothetical protein BC629DRAFT_1440397 [Irpex lacteus]